VTEAVRTARVACTSEWGLDHASWAVLRHLYPAASIPVWELSLDYQFNEPRPKSLQYHYDIAKELSEFRHQGVLIIGSGNIVHNLSMLDYENIDAATFEWAGEFDEQVKTNLIRGNHSALMHFHEMGRSDARSLSSDDLRYCVAGKE